MEQPSQGPISITGYSSSGNAGPDRSKPLRMRSTCLRYVGMLSLLMSTNVTVSDAQNIDSLKAVWRDASLHDTIRLKAFNAVIWGAYLFRQPDSTLILADSMRTYALSRGLKLHAGDAFMIRGIHFAMSGDYTSALEELNLAKDLYEQCGNANGVARVQNNMGNVYWKQGQLKSAIEMYTAVLRTQERLGLKKGVASAELNIGLIYSDLGDEVRATDHFKTALVIYTQLGSEDGIGMASQNLAIQALAVRDTTGAIKLFGAALDAYIRTGNKMQQMGPLTGLAKVYTEKRQWDKALQCIDRADSLSEELGEEFGAQALIARSDYHFLRREFALSLKAAEAANALTAKIGTIKDRRNVAQLLYRSYRELGRLSEAIKYQDLYQDLNDSLRSDGTVLETNKHQESRMSYDTPV